MIVTSLLMTVLKHNLAQDSNGTQFPDLAYVQNGHERQKLDLFLPKPFNAGDKPIPVILWIHGGGWSQGSRKQCLPVREGYLEQGYAIASLGYRLSGDAIHPAQINDVMAAVVWLKKNATKYGLDRDHFAAWGSSAGGHLASLLGTFGGREVGKDTSRVQAVVSYYGPTDFAAFVKTPGYERHADASSGESKLVGGPVLEKAEISKQVSPTTHVSKSSPPFLFVHGSADPVVPHNQSELLFDALKRSNVPARFHTIEGAGHGGPSFSDKKVLALVDQFLQYRLKGQGTDFPAYEKTASKSEAPANGRGAQPRQPAGRAVPWSQLIERRDTNKDGKISQSEFPGPAALFKRLDQNGDGFIDKSEYPQNESIV
jgi:acetyl esterase/lipase